jgi:hypothetical protein
MVCLKATLPTNLCSRAGPTVLTSRPSQPGRPRERGQKKKVRQNLVGLVLAPGGALVKGAAIVLTPANTVLRRVMGTGTSVANQVTEIARALAAAF